MELMDRSTSPLAVLFVALLTVATIGLSAFVVNSVPTGAVAAATGTPAPTSDATATVMDVSPSPSSDLPSASPEASPPPPSPSPSATPAPTPKPVLAMNLYHKGDFVSELTPVQCVSAAMQIMLNVIGPTEDRTSRTQTALAKLAESLSDAPYGGTEPPACARGLQQRRAGHNKDAAAATRL